MKTSLNIENKINMITEMRGDSVFQVLEYDSLKGGNSLELAVKLNQMKEANIKLRQVRIILEDSSVNIEKGALSYMRGPISMKNKIGGPIGLGKKLFSSKVIGESTFKPKYEGTGDIFLEPSFGHYALIELEDDEIIVDDGLFYACESSVEITAHMNKSLSSMVLGNEGVFQTKLSGNGIAVLEIPVPEEEIFKCKINNDVLKVDGNFAILRTGDIDFTVEKSSKSLVSTATGGEGFLNVFRGTGEVWLIPTKSVYEKLEKGWNSLKPLTDPKGSSNTKI
ncbi:AIM24 family protein [Clostridium perfringens]|uniref:AIM24 family protein n=1 Tax=Clostridium perfringens TaxID=1502 RepID=UPI0013E2A6AF|nr:AIM24 family protein [Clostridium perfringens]NGT77834.1 AIM24 family protein [Clostridium perfringens]